MSKNIFPITIILEKDSTGENRKAVGGIEFNPIDDGDIAITSNVKLENGKTYACEITCNIFPSLSTSLLAQLSNHRTRFVTIRVIDIVENQKPHCFKYRVTIVK